MNPAIILPMNSPIGTLEAIAEILHRNLSFEEAEARLAEIMKPARLSPVDGKERE